MRKHKVKRSYMTEEQKAQIIELHKEGWSTKQIYEMVGTTKSATYNFMRKNGLKSNASKTTDPVLRKKIEELYLSGLTIKEINQKHLPNVKEGTINLVLRQAGITRPNGRKPSFNQDYFETIDDERKAYWLGFIMADGSIIEKTGVNGNVTGMTLRIELKKDDDYHLEAFIKDISSDNKVRYYYSEKDMGKDKFTKPKHNAYVSFGSRKLCKDLNKYGVVPRKSLIISELPNIPKEYMRHYIRGFFDGNGCVSLMKQYDGISCKFSSTYKFATVLRDYLVSEIGINNVKVAQSKECNVSQFSFSAKRDVVNFYNYLYQDATVYLNRKKDIFDNHRYIKDLNRE